MKQYLITKTITISFECEAKSKKDAFHQFAEDFEQLFDNSDCKFDDGEKETYYIAGENGEYVHEEG
jgi:hypothetical protein